MQRKFKHTFTKSKMNQDLDARLLSADEYREGVNISVSRAEADDVGALENILGNSLISSLNNIQSEYLSQVIGWFFNQDTNKVYIFDTNFQDNSIDQLSEFAAVGTIHRILLVNLDTQVLSTITQGRFLNFSWNSRINDIVILEDLMFWTDNRNQPRMINVNTAESDNNYYSHEDHVSVAKYYPHKPISLNSTFNPQVYGVNGANDWLNPAADRWQSIYNYVILRPDQNPTKEYEIEVLNIPIADAKDGTTVAAIRNNIGMQCYMKAETSTPGEFEIFEAKVAGTMIWPYVNSGSALAPVQYGLTVFFDRDLGGTAGGFANFPDDPSDLDTEFIPGTPSNFFFTDANAKDVSSPWLRQSAARLSLKATTNNDIKYAVDNTFGSGYCNLLYNSGTFISNYNNDQIAPTTGSIADPVWDFQGPYFLRNHFPKNIGNPDAVNGYVRILHPQLDDLKYYVVKNPTDPTLSSSQGFEIWELTSFVNGNLIKQDPLALGLTNGDVLSVHLPNPSYDFEFPGDSNFLSDKFVRFSYRFKYDDGQYSLIAPFTQNIFIPKQNGYFLKDIGEIRSNTNTVSPDNNYIPQENTIGQNTINNFMTNEVTNAVLNINCEYKINELANKLKVNEIDILYKESDTNNINVIDTINVNDTSVTSNSTKTLKYIYQSKAPIKTLRSAETTRVYDTVPVRAKTLSASGNRIIYGNFFDRHTSPQGLGYFVCASSKMTPGSITQTKDVIIGTPKNDPSPYLPNKFASVSYPNHSLKQNRSYQVGLVLQDRYGRSSDVILSNFSETNFTLRDGVYENDPLTFFGSTLSHEYLNSVLEPSTANADVTTSNKIYSGIINWPGDSLKMLFTEELPRTVSYASGYPGLYEDPFTTATMINNPFVDSTTGVSYIHITPGGSNDNIRPGMVLEWQADYNDTAISRLLVKSTTINYQPDIIDPAVNILYLTDEDGNYVSLSDLPQKFIANTPISIGNIPTPMQFIEAENSLGWYSYKVVVKQKEQDYYNVYLPSLLSGTPVIKPFVLTCTVAASSNIFTVDPIGTMEYLTFPLLRGMKLTNGSNTFFISNILNYTQFEVTQKNGPTALTSLNFTFSTSSSIGILNTTTLLTDNSNKVPPALTETSPVQQNYSTSEVDLIPRYAYSNKWSLTPGDNFNITNTSAMPIFPGNQITKVQSLGNFESLYPRASYFGLYNSDTDPIVATIEDKFNIGQNANLVKPDNEAETVAAVYETTPTRSEIDIYYETSTSGTVKSLNQLVRDNLVIPSNFVTSGTTTNLSIVSVLESVDFTDTTTPLVEFQVVDQDNNVLSYQQAENFIVSTVLYANGVVVNNGISPFTIAKTNVNNAYKITSTATNPLYHADNSLLNTVNFNISFTFLQFNVLPLNYSIPLSVFIQNVSPKKVDNYVESSSDVYVFWNNEGTDPAPKAAVASYADPNSPDPYEFLSSGWNNVNGLNTSLSQATNGSNVNNVGKKEEISWGYQVSLDNNTSFQNILDPSTGYTPISGLGLTLSAPATDKRLVIIGNFSNVYTNRTIYVRITATDGGGLQTIVSEFAMKVVDRPFVANQYNVANMILRQAGTGFPAQDFYPTAISNGDTIRSGNGIFAYYTGLPNPKPLPTTSQMISFGFSGVGTQYNIGSSGSGIAGNIIGAQGQMEITSNGTYQTGDLIITALSQVQSGNSTSITGNQPPYSNAFYVLTPSLFNVTPPA